ncbi:ATP-binding protein [Flavobacteriales bacterium]|nr:ATP-binding protein [Flavobacteriales bacterium]
MRFNTPITISLFLSAGLFVLAGSLFYVASGTEYFLLSLVLFFWFSVVLIYQVVKLYIQSKISVIYKNIYKHKGVTRFVDVDIDSVEKEVENWAIQKENEILQMKASETYRREFIGNVSHELKTPIFNIQGYILTLLDGGLYDEEVNMKYLKRTSKSVDRMINIVDDLEVITRLETEETQLEIGEFNIVELAKDVLDQLELKANESKIELSIQKEILTEFVLGDIDKIQQVFANLISNSIKYGKEGGRTEVRFFDMNENILIEISDDGIGISEMDLPRLFERFYRVDKNRSRKIGGTGLGLAIVKHIIEAHNQTINVRSTVDVGSTFSFILEKAK